MDNIVFVPGKFLSTLSLRRATARRASRQQPAGISIHALLAESDNSRTQADPVKSISIHALLAESDAHYDNYNLHCTISIHALLAESDIRQHSKPDGGRMNFYPRSPCGERLSKIDAGRSVKTFLSTLSLRRATAKVHKTVGHFCAYETNFMGIASSC